MKFHVMTLFPEMILQGVNTSILGRAMEKNLIEIDAVNMRDYSLDKHHKVDDYTYGGGAGMLLQAQPVYDAWMNITKGKKVRTVYVTPQGKVFSQSMAKAFSKEEELIILCGHYEGIDERVLDEIVTDRVSIGDYVLTGGELPAMVMIDAISRLVPGVLNNEDSAQTESFHNDLLEYPQYSRPEVWHDKKVPDVLLSGNHKNIMAWRLEQSKLRTQAARPDLYEKYVQKEKLIQKLGKSKRQYIHMMENLYRGLADVKLSEGKNILIYNEDCKTAMIAGEETALNDSVLQAIPETCTKVYTSEPHTSKFMSQHTAFELVGNYHLVLYTKKVALPLKHKEIRVLNPGLLETPCGCEEALRESIYSSEEWKDLVKNNRVFGAYDGERLLGHIALGLDGSIQHLYVSETEGGDYIGTSLIAFVSNLLMQQEATPFAYYEVGDEASRDMFEKLGFYQANDTLDIFSRK